MTTSEQQQGVYEYPRKLEIAHIDYYSKGELLVRATPWKEDCPEGQWSIRLTETVRDAAAFPGHDWDVFSHVPREQVSKWVERLGAVFEVYLEAEAHLDAAVKQS